MTEDKTQEMTVEDEPTATGGKLVPYTFTAEPKHKKYGLRTGALYRGMRNSKGRTVGRPVLVHDPFYGPMQPTLRGMIPFVKPHRWIDDNGKPVPEDDPAWVSANNAIAWIDYSLVLLAIGVVAVLVPTLS